MRKRRNIAFAVLILAVLAALVLSLSACAEKQTKTALEPYSIGWDGRVYTVTPIDNDKGTISDGTNTYSYRYDASGTGYSVTFTYPDGETYTWKEDGNFSSGSTSPDFDFDKYPDGMTLKRVLEIASILGKPETPQLARIREYSEGAKRAYQELVTKDGYSLDTDRQAKLVRPLYMGLSTPEHVAFARKRLIAALDHYGWRLGTGFLSTPMILDVLAGLDISYAYRLLENEEMPGWLFMPKSGATTIWEAWEGNQKDKWIASLNHYSKGAVCEWLMNTMCGIRITGEKHVTIAPKPGGDITFARASYWSICGNVTTSWERTENGYRLTVGIPANTTAEILLPDGTGRTVGAGQHRYEWK